MRLSSLLTLCLLWGTLAFGLLVLFGDDAVFTVAFVIIALVGIVVLGALGWRDAPKSGPPFEARPLGASAPPPRFSSQRQFGDAPSDIPTALGMYPLYLLENRYPPFSAWAESGFEIGAELAPILRRIVWAYQLHACSEMASPHYGDPAVQRLRQVHLEVLAREDPALAVTCKLLFRALRENSGELEPAAPGDPDIDKSLEYYLAADMLEDDPTSPYHVGIADAPAHGNPRDRERMLARCLAHGRAAVLEAFDGFFAASAPRAEG